MQMKSHKKLLPFILCMALVVAMTLFTTGCSRGASDNTASNAASDGDNQADITVLGTGSAEFMLTVTDKDGGEERFEIHTDKETVGEALLELGLLEGDKGQYGLYVTTVNGITADYNVDGVYWAFYINGEYASVGVDAAKITEGESYAFRVE